MSNQPELKELALQEKPVLEQESHRIREVYTQRQTDPVAAAVTPFDLRGRCAVHEREELFIRILLQQGLTSLEGFKILDVGCGAGSQLRHLFDLGADPANCFGIDLLDSRLRLAKRLSPGVTYIRSSGASLPFPPETFDLVLQSLVFTSVLDAKIRSAIASEILRTLRKGGRFIWYDFAYNNPRNANVRGIRLREIRDLFPGCRLQSQRLTLAPPIGRAAVRFSSFLYYALSQLPFLRTHYLCVIEKL